MPYSLPAAVVLRLRPCAAFHELSVAEKAAAEAAAKLRQERAEQKEREAKLGPIRKAALWISRRWCVPNQQQQQHQPQQQHSTAARRKHEDGSI